MTRGLPPDQRGVPPRRTVRRELHRLGRAVRSSAEPLGAAPRALRPRRSPPYTRRVRTPALECLDHLVYAARDLDVTIADLERRLGVRASPGGRHLGRGTRNALIALGPTTYLEILAPDFDQPEPATPRWLGVDTIERPTLSAWAIRCADVAELAARAERAGVQLGTVLTGSRERPDGVLLEWTYTDPRVMVGGGIVPFLIDWGRSPHPASGAAAGHRSWPCAPSTRSPNRSAGRSRRWAWTWR